MKKLFIILLLFPFYLFGQNNNIFFNYCSGIQWKPTDIAGCVLWLPADGGNVWQDAAKTVPCTDGTAVYTWEDLAVANDGVQSTGANQPLWVDAQLNGEPVIRFDGSTDFMINSTLVVNQPYTIFIVAKDVSTAVSNWFIANYPNMALANYPLPDTYTIYAGSWVNSTITYPFGYSYLSAIYNGASSEVWENGTSMGSGNAGANGIDATVGGVEYRLYIGSVPPSWGGIRANCDIAEIIIYDSALSDPNRVIVENYLLLKYGLSVEWYIIGGLMIGLCFKRKKYFSQFKQAA